MFFWSYIKCSGSSIGFLKSPFLYRHRIFSTAAANCAYQQGTPVQNWVCREATVACDHHPLDPASSTSLLQSCQETGSLSHGRLLHHYIVEHGHDSHPAVASHLIRLYCTCGPLADAAVLFIGDNRQNVLLWNFLLRAHTQAKLYEDAKQVFHQMQIEGVLPNKVTFTYFAEMSTRCTALECGKQAHAMLSECTFSLNVVLGTALIGMYGKCGSLENVQKTFERLPERDVVTWSTIMALYVQQGLSKAALHCFKQMQQEAVLPNSVTFASMVDACANQAAVREGRQTHSQVEVVISIGDLLLSTSLLNMYGKCGVYKDASRIFAETLDRDTVMWNAMIAVHVQNEGWKQALQMFNQMQHEGIMSNKFTYTCVLDALANEQMLAEGKRVHTGILARQFDVDLVLGTALISLYGSCGCLQKAHQIFDEMHNQDAISWTALITSYAKYGLYDKSIQLFEHMQDVVGLDHITYVSILNTCMGKTALSAGKWLHNHLVASDFEADLRVWNAILKMYGRCHSLKDAEKVFEIICNTDVDSWNALILAHHENKESGEAWQLLCDMQKEGILPDKVTYIYLLSSFASELYLRTGKYIHTFIVGLGLEHELVSGLVNMYVACGGIKDANFMFENLRRQDVVVWSTMVASYARHGKDQEALHIFEQMKIAGIVPNMAALASIITVCANLTALSMGKGVHAYMRDIGCESDVNVGNALINFYGKCGCAITAKDIFHNMLDKDLVSWNSIITIYAQHGLCKEALQLLEQMQQEGPAPDKVTLTSVLTACSYAGSLDAGCKIIALMETDYGIVPDEYHYGCVIDLLGRAGQLNEAEDLINNMPVELTAISFTALLSACISRVDVELGVRTVRHVFNLNAENIAFQMLSQIYAAVVMQGVRSQESEAINDRMHAAVVMAQA